MKLFDLKIAAQQISSWLVMGWAIAFTNSTGDAAERNDTFVVAALDNEDSQRVAAEFCQAFEIPQTNILSLNFPAGDQLSRTAWEDELRPQVVAWLNENDSESKIANVITVYGTPLAVAAWEDERETKPWRDFYAKALDARLGQINQSIEKLAEIAGQPVAAEPTAEATLADMRKQFDDSVAAAQQSISSLKFDQLKTAKATLQSQVRIVAGLYPFLGSLKNESESGSTEAARANEQFHYLRGRTEALAQAAELMDRVPASFEREATILQLLERNGGLLSAIGWLKRQQKMVEENDSAASLDSELALVLWPKYRRLGTTPNLLHPAFETSPLRSVYRTLSVTRIDGPTPESALALIERATEATKIESLSGKVYVDLRGATGNDATANRKERWLQSVASQFKSVENIDAVVESTAELFPVDGCPDTMLYCGWYSLEKYIDSFTFKPGAIAYHLTPGDALGIHDSDNQGWCRNLIEKGATVVVGSVGRPEIVGFSSLDPKQKRVHPVALSSGMIVFGIDGLTPADPDDSGVGK
ncbi:TIGR03790 family protein [Mariniblastus fucicola]|uniref:TIGR03790 family protein n=1 Tax=Mariniblastus fucicola TaxID=980251 RepID=A0A5B9PAB3_9BACT|nr:TIGR03790 family protein [Mariniblastus fucicola]QEG22429.1 hypothetical protein MFFC18_23090 [Mariniblastus fucicola]